MKENPVQWPYSHDLLERIPGYIACINRAIELAEIKPNDRVLECGVGPGTSTKRLILIPGCEVIAIDIERNCLIDIRNDVAQRLLESNSRISLLQADVCQMPFKDNIYDKIVATFTFGRLADPDPSQSNPVKKNPKLAALMNCHKLLKPGGKLAISEMCIDFNGNIDDEWGRRVTERWEKMINMVRKCALSCAEISSEFSERLLKMVEFEENIETKTVKERQGKYFIGSKQWGSLLEEAGFSEIKIEVTDKELGYTAIVATKI